MILRLGGSCGAVVFVDRCEVRWEAVSGFGCWFGWVRVRCGVEEVEELGVALAFWIIGSRDNSAAYQPLFARGGPRDLLGVVLK